MAGFFAPERYFMTIAIDVMDFNGKLLADELLNNRFAWGNNGEDHCSVHYVMQQDKNCNLWWELICKNNYENKWSFIANLYDGVKLLDKIVYYFTVVNGEVDKDSIREVPLIRGE